jgi:hypothetical protein
MTCYYNWERYRTTFQNIELMLKMCHDEGGEGTVSYAVHDPAWTDHEMLMASYAWNQDAVSDREDQRRLWAESRFGASADRFLDGLAALQKAALGFPALDPCWFYPYSYSRANSPWPRRYPEEALEKLADLEDVNVASQLISAADTANRAIGDFSDLIDTEGLTRDDRAGASSLMGEAARVEGLARAFTYLFRTWSAVQEGEVDPSSAETAAAVREDLIRAMGKLEDGKPDYVVPASLQALSVLLAFLDQLSAQLEEVRDGSREPKDVDWAVAFTARQ